MSKNLEASIEQLRAKASGTVEIFSKPTAPQGPHSKTWDEDTLKQLNSTLFFPEKLLKDQSIQKTVCIRFYQFYFRGIVPSGLRVQDVLLAPIAIIPPDPKYGGSYSSIFESSDFEENEKESFIQVDPSLDQSQDTSAASGSGDAPIGTMVTHGSGDMKEFSSQVKVILDNWNVGPPINNSTWGLLRTTGFLALMMLRFMVNNKAQMSKAFKKDSLRSNLAQYGAWPTYRKFSPPCDEALQIASIGLRKNEKVTRSMFIKVVHASVVLMSDETPKNKNVEAYLSASLLRHTAGDGLGLVTLVQTASRVLGKPWTEIMDTTFFDVTEISWTRFTQFYVDHEKGKRSSGYSWARIIDDGYLMNLGCDENYFLAGILAVVSAADQQNDGIWKSVWAQRRRFQLRTPITIGKALMLHYDKSPGDYSPDGNWSR